MTEQTIELFGVQIKTEDELGTQKLEYTINSLLSCIASYGEVNQISSIKEHNQRCSLIVEILVDNIDHSQLSLSDSDLINSSPKIRDYLIQSCSMHDVGKCRVPAQILLKPSELNEIEFQIIKEHTSDPQNNLFVDELKLNRNSYISILKDCVRSHHENWDGSGYPDQLSGTDIPLVGRLMRLVDVLDNLMTRTPYRKPLSFDDASDVIIKLRHIIFDPVIVSSFIVAKEEIKELIIN